jgi:hypothetical protein
MRGTAINNELGDFKKNCDNFMVFCQEGWIGRIRTFISEPDPTWPKTVGSDRVRMYMVGFIINVETESYGIGTVSSFLILYLRLLVRHLRLDTRRSASYSKLQGIKKF